MSILALLLTFTGCVEIRRVLTHLFSGSYGPPDNVPALTVEYSGMDTLRQRIPITLTLVAKGIDQPTDIQFDPAHPHIMIVLEKEGKMKWRDIVSGDGGWIGDPHNNGQNTATLLGKMLRIDPTPRSDLLYAIPSDNPFVHLAGYRPELWATGLRNPWRYSFDPQGRLIVADVGQNAWEEINIVEKGKNYGWRCREALAPYDTSEGCAGKTFAQPFYVYGRDEGLSITGGYVYLADDFPALKGLYIFGDFISGRLWALTLPEQPEDRLRSSDAFTLGQWPIQIPTFGRDAHGKVYVADYGLGAIYRIDPAQ